MNERLRRHVHEVLPMMLIVAVLPLLVTVAVGLTPSWPLAVMPVLI